MFRTTLGALPRSLRRASPNQSAAWEQAWRRFLTSESTLQAVRQTSRVTQAPSLGLAATRRLGTTARPRLSSGQAVFRAPQRRGFRFSPWRRNKGNGAGAGESLSLTERFRKLSREYGRAAIGVYFLLSICDYPFFFLLVKAVGTERIGESGISAEPGP
jgi:N-terminal acetyltransferase 2